MKNNYYAQWIVVAVVLVTLACCNAEYVEPEKFVKNYAKINKYLEKNLPNSDDPEANLVKANDLIEETTKSKSCKLFGCGLSMIETIKLLNNFTEGATVCKNLNGRQYANNIDDAFEELAKTKKPNEPLTRVDKIIEHYALKIALNCGVDSNYRLKRHGYKQPSYEKIEELLVQKLPENEGIESNVAAAESLLASSSPSVGALALALRQLLDLRKVLDLGCTEQSYQILLVNDLATKVRVHSHTDYARRRVDKIYKYYAMEHEEMCRHKGREMLAALLKNLDADTYRRVLGLTVSKFVRINQFREVAESLKGKAIDDKFSLPLMDKVAKETAKRSSNHMVHLEERSEPALADIYYWARAIAYTDSSSKLSLVDGQMDRYVTIPCSKFLKVFRAKIDADEFSGNMDPDHTASPRDEFLNDITYHMVREANRVCKHVEINQNALFERVGHMNELGSLVQ